MIRYGHGSYRQMPTFHCNSRSVCDITLIGHPLPCPQGGYHMNDGMCEACCANNACVGNLTNYIRLDLVSSNNLFCPGRCHVNDVQKCIHAGRLCNHDAFCQNKNAYDGSNKHYCFLDCCANNECLFPHFGLHMAHAVSPTSLPAAAAPSWNSTGLWEQLRGSCEDAFDLALCQSLKDDHDLCRNRLHLSMCPKTCGICSTVGSYVCNDKSDVCKTLKSQPGFCDTEEGEFECPTSCGKCEQLLDSVILSIIDGTATGRSHCQSKILSVIDGTATVPPELTTPPPMDCSSIRPEDCVHFGPLCKTTFLDVVCPAQCDFCVNGEAVNA
ncbi:hypothetical protein ElyMa_000560900 [Elysia marginata]|uniref:ShKT domain-containing protein n=1 Tax=Elysia marginata TaxID=1093978 RepID=A0AAV4G3B8_9GAST|nr:hypothetical protein ElyMa_000560900 [Elysia marginata]